MAPARFTNDSIASDNRPTEPVTCQASVLSTMVSSATATEAHSRWRGLSQRRGAAGQVGMVAGLLGQWQRACKLHQFSGGARDAAKPALPGRRRPEGKVRGQPTRGVSAFGFYTRAMGLLILGIESSCDETGVALVRSIGAARPSRAHTRRVLPLTTQVLRASGQRLADVDVLAYTRGPGLAGALLVGAGLARALAAGLGKPVVGVHHLEGHLLSPFLSADPPEFPFVALLVSGGHTQLMRVDGVGRYALLGETIDDAAGEAFDKSAKLMGLGYPGGPALARLAEQGSATAFGLPRPLLHSGDLDFSFAGLKTAVLTQVRKLGDQLPARKADLAASTEAAIVQVLVKKTLAALRQTGLQRIVVAGGVGPNRRLRQQLDAACADSGLRVHYPELELCTDNGAMIALAAAMRLQAGVQQAGTDYAFDVLPRWPLAASA